MRDPRLDGKHLHIARRDQYDAAVDEMLDDRGPRTSAADPLVRMPSVPLKTVRRAAPPPGGTYILESLIDGRRHPLRVGINAVGRRPENDLVLEPIYISRRHCVILVHATGGCEVYNTASKHGIWVNHCRVDRVELLPGDLLALCDLTFVLGWVGSAGELFASAEKEETECIGGLSPTG
jgi:pSer/pThr/pTyr-binding forkhead associated (FHA) protein